MVGIYKITNPIGQVYVGQSKDVEQRFKSYKTMTSSVNGKLKASFIKHGADNHVFEIIEECLVDELNSRERFWQDKLNTIHDGLNSNQTKPVVKRERRLTYGEHTVMVSVRVPESKKDEILNKFYSVLDTYIVSSFISNEEKSNPTDEVLVKAEVEKEVYDAPKVKDLIKDEPSQFVNPKDKKVDMDALRDIASGKGLKGTFALTKKKVNIDEEYEFEYVKSVPDQDDQIVVDKKGLAFYSKYDLGVFYVKWEGKYMRFDSKAEFDRFGKEYLTF